MAAAQSSRASSRSTSAGPGVHAAGASFYRSPSSGYGARSAYASSTCPHHHQYQPHHHAAPAAPSHGRHHHAASSFANLGASHSHGHSHHHHYPSSASAFASSTSSSFLTSSSSRSDVPGLFHQYHPQRSASPTRVNLVAAGAASSAAAPSVRFSLDTRSISPHSRPIAVAPSARRADHHLHGQHHNHHGHPHHHYHHTHLHHHGGHHHQIASGGGGGGGYSRPVAAGAQHGHAPQRRTCMCSPTTHPGSFRCALHKAAAAAAFGGSGSPSYSSPSNRLNARRSAMTNSLVRIGTVEGDLVKRALAALIRPSSHQLRRRSAFQPRPSRLSAMSCAADNDCCAAA